MSNLRSTTGHVPLKSSMGNKWKSQAVNSEMLERQTRALEESLNKLKIAMHPDKNKTSSESTGSIWDKGKSGPLSQYANHVLHDETRRTFDPNRPTKVRVLADEPVVAPVRPSLVANLFSQKSNNNDKSIIKCGQCEKDEAKMKCLECAESYCAGCFAHFHLRGALQRHRCVPLAESRPNSAQRKKPGVGADVIFKELRFAQSKEDIFRQSTATNNEEFDQFDEEMAGGDLLRGNYDEKSSAASFQQALMQWRQTVPKNPTTKTKKTHEAQIDTVYDGNGTINQIPMPKIEFNSSKLTYGEKLLVKKYRRDKNSANADRNSEVSTSRTVSSRNSNIGKTTPEKLEFNVETLFPDSTNSQAPETDRTIVPEEPERPATSRNRPVSSASKRKASATPRPPSASLFQAPLPSLLATGPSDDLKSIVEGQQSRPSSAAPKKSSRIESRIPSMWNRNWKPEQSMSNELDLKTIEIDQNSIKQFDKALEDLLDEGKIENEEPISVVPRPTQNEPTGRRSLFTFHDSPRRADSSESGETGELGFFTDGNLTKNPKPTISVEGRKSVEQRSIRSPLRSLRLNSNGNFSPTPPKRSTNIEELRLTPNNEDYSRPPSSMSSASLPVSIISSQPDQITRPSIERNPKFPSKNSKKFRVEFQKKTTPPPPPPMLIEGKKVTSAREREDPLNSSRPKYSASINKSISNSANHQNLVKTSSTSSMTSITRDENILRDESLTINDASNHRNSLRRSTKSRRVEFPSKDGTKSHKNSASLSASKSLSARPSTPSNPTNTRIGNQYSSYDADDGRSSRACQDVEDEACFNQLRQELSSQLSMRSPDWDASLSEHVLKNLRANEVPLSEKELQENLNLLETKIREKEMLQRSQTDDDISVHEEIRNL